MQINLEFMSMLAECQQNFHLPEYMKGLTTFHDFSNFKEEYTYLSTIQNSG
jgi:hypothetical protein